jgi:SAM-dependent methyltransferase
LYENRESAQFHIEYSRIAIRIMLSLAIGQLKRLAKSAALPGDVHRILDYGCGSGIFSLAAHAVFDGATVVAADFAPSPPPLLQGGPANLQYTPLSVLKSCSEKFDLVILRHVLEHVHAPGDLLRDLAPLIRGRGVLWLEVPSVDTVCASLFGRFWHGYYVPFHLYHFTIVSLKRLLMASGLDPVTVGRGHMPLLGRTFGNILNCGDNMALHAAGMVLYPAQIACDSLFGRSTTLSMVCRKKNEQR